MKTISHHLGRILFIILVFAAVVSVVQPQEVDNLILDIEVDVPVVYAASIDPSHEFLALVSDDLIILDLETGEIIETVAFGGGMMRSAIWSTDGSQLGIYLPLAEEVTTDDFEHVYDTASWEELSIDAATIDWEFEFPDVVFRPDTFNVTGNTSGAITDSLNLTLGNPIRISGANNLELGNGNAGAHWYAETGWVLHWSMYGEAELWDIESGEMLLSAIHYAGDPFTADAIPFAPSLTQSDYLVTVTYGGIYPGAQAEVFVLDDGLSLRAAPSVSGNLLEKMPSGTQVTLTGLPVEADGYLWWPLTSPSGNTGWSVQMADNIETLRPIFTPFEGTTPVKVYQIGGVSDETSEAAATEDSEGSSDTCELTANEDVTLYTGPSTAFNKSGTFAADTTQEPSKQIEDNDGFIWWEVDDGWVREDNVTASAGCAFN